MGKTGGGEDRVNSVLRRKKRRTLIRFLMMTMMTSMEKVFSMWMESSLV